MDRPHVFKKTNSLLLLHLRLFPFFSIKNNAMINSLIVSFIQFLISLGGSTDLSVRTLEMLSNGLLRVCIIVFIFPLSNV